MKVTIRKVAEVAGVSVSTVSKVINGHYSISEKTAQHVRKVMSELNYYPSASAQSFATGDTKNIVLLADMSANTAFRNPHMFEIVAGMEESLQRRGYRLLLHGTDSTSACAVAKEIISRKSADGIAIHVGIMSHPLAALLVQLRFPHIVLGMPDFESQVCWIDNNNTYSGTIAASYLLTKGYRNIAFIGGKSYDLGSTHRLQGVKQGLRDAGVRLEEQNIWLGDSTRAEGYRMTASLLDQQPLPDAIICANNYIALGCVGAIHDKGLSIPGDIGVMTFDDYPFSQIIEPQLTVVDINVRDMGIQAGRMLLDIVRHPNMQVQTYITTSNLLERISTQK
ncbi:MAG: LacI family DNA-binding transcriptional regulator [Faecousia sp.]